MYVHTHTLLVKEYNVYTMLHIGWLIKGLYIDHARLYTYMYFTHTHTHTHTEREKRYINYHTHQ